MPLNTFIDLVKITFPWVSIILIWTALSESMLFETMLIDPELGFGNIEKDSSPSD